MYNAEAPTIAPIEAEEAAEDDASADGKDNNDATADGKDNIEAEEDDDDNDNDNDADDDDDANDEDDAEDDEDNEDDEAMMDDEPAAQTDTSKVSRSGCVVKPRIDDMTPDEHDDVEVPLKPLKFESTVKLEDVTMVTLPILTVRGEEPGSGAGGCESDICA